VQPGTSIFRISPTDRNDLGGKVADINSSCIMLPGNRDASPESEPRNMPKCRWMYLPETTGDDGRSGQRRVPAGLKMLRVASQ
jgi:hypothetical protein